MKVIKKFYKSCIHCGKFVPKALWIDKNHPKYKGAACSKCLSQFDSGHESY